MDKIKKNSTLVNIQGLSLFLEQYKNKILDEHSPIISELNIKIDKFTIQEENQDIRLYSHDFKDTFKTELKDINIEKEVLVNCEPQDAVVSEFSLLNTNLFNIEQKKKNMIISKFSEEEIVDYPNWYVLKINPYFLLLSIDRIKEKLLAPHRFSTIDKYILGIKEIIEENKSEIDPTMFSDFTQELDKAQKKAFAVMVNSKNLALIKGPPGTGKTTVIERFLEYSLRTDPKRRIIFATNLHSSMDSIIEKVNNNKFLRTKNILRLTKKPHSRRTAKHKILNISKLADVYVTTLASQRMNTVLLEKSF
jgi:Flp pilus assembly CpaF family ATPase